MMEEMDYKYERFSRVARKLKLSLKIEEIDIMKKKQIFSDVSLLKNTSPMAKQKLICCPY